jgi:hypothetical protein
MYSSESCNVATPIAHTQLGRSQLRDLARLSRRTRLAARAIVIRSAVVALVALAACAVDQGDMIDGDAIDGDVADDPDPEGKADDATLIWYTPLPGEQFLPTAKLQVETRRLFKTEAQWVAFFDQPSPSIDWSTRWVIFYAPGNNTLEVGDRAKLSRVRLSASGKTLSITTRLEGREDACPWRSARPFVLASIPPIASKPTTRYYKSDVELTCN